MATNVTAKNGIRVTCCCDNCQSFAHFLNNADEILDEFGGTDIYQTSQSQIKIEQGAEQLRSVKLTKKGLVRWYTECCKTPIGNTVSGAMPFIGVIHSFMDDDGNRDKNLGSVQMMVMTKYALKPTMHPNCAEKFPLGLSLKIAGKMLGWKIRGMQKPSVFFNNDGKPVSSPTRRYSTTDSEQVG